jgi:hypothetical protein
MVLKENLKDSRLLDVLTPALLKVFYEISVKRSNLSTCAIPEYIMSMSGDVPS